MHVVTRRLAVADVEILHAALSWSRPSEAISVERCATLLRRLEHYYIVAMRDGEPVGLTVGYELERFRGPVMFIYEIGVHPDHRRLGIATGMIKELIVCCKRCEMMEMFVLTSEANGAAMHLYEATGGLRDGVDDVMFTYEFERRRQETDI